MNIEDVRKVFGAVAPSPIVSENKNYVIPVVAIILIVGVGYIFYSDVKIKEKYNN